MRTLLENRNDLADWKREVLRDVRWHLSRRDVLKAAAVGLAALAGPGALTRRALAAPRAHLPRVHMPPEIAPAPTGGAVKTGTFYFPRMMFHVNDGTPDQWNTDPVGDAILRDRLKRLTNINVSRDPIVVRLADLDHMCRYPFVFATSEGYFRLPDQEEKNLREFLMRGGFVLADDCVLGRTGDRFFQDYRKLMRRVFPRHEIRKVPKNHELYHCYFDFPDGAVHLQGQKHGDWAVFEKGTGRILTLNVPGDLHCGWCSMFFTPAQNEQAIRMGVNIVIYYLTH